MLLAESLSRALPDQLSRIALSAGLEPGTDRAALERELVSCLTDRAWLQGLLADLSDEEWAALKVVFFNGGDQGITVELCHQIVNLLSGKRRKSSAKAVEELQDRGLVYLRTQNYRQVFYIPQDVLSVLADILNRQMVYRLCLPTNASVRPTPADRNLLEDLYRFLAYVQKNEITLTQQGQIFKRHLRALLELLVPDSMDDESLAGRYPEPLGLLVGYSLDRRLILREDGLLSPGEELQALVRRDPGETLLDLFRYWQDRYYYQDLQTFLSVMRSVGEHWVSVDRLAQEVEPLVNPSQRGSFVLRLRHHLITFLEPLGLIELGELETEAGPEMVCRLRETGAAILDGEPPQLAGAPGQPTLLLEATFEVIAPRPVSPEHLWMLELMADLVKRTERTLTYHLSRHSVYRALKAGIPGAELLQFLQTHSATGVPQNVAFDLESWASSYGQIYLQAVTLLRCASPILAQQVKSSRRTGRFVLGELTPVDLIVSSQDYKELLEALQADGLMPRPDIERMG